MQHKSDILDALANPRSRFSDLEDAFRALVAWPQEDMIRGFTGNGDALDLLGRIANALVDIGDTRIMPNDTVVLLETMAAERGQSLVQATYMAGGLFVRNGLGRWRTTLFDVKTEG